jgi:hypothetical protein
MHVLQNQSKWYEFIIRLKHLPYEIDLPTLQISILFENKSKQIFGYNYLSLRTIYSLMTL